MTVPTFQEIIEEKNGREFYARVVIGGAQLPKVDDIRIQFDMGSTPTLNIIVPNLAWLPFAVAEEASVQVFFGFRWGVVELEKMVFGGAVVDSVSNNGSEINIECVMDAGRKLTYGYNRRILFDFDTVTAEEAVRALLVLAGISTSMSYVELDPWLIGSVVVQQLEFSTYGEAINKVSEVDGSPWYCLPTGLVHVENRVAIPSETARRQYFTSELTGAVSSIPSAITNTDSRPRIINIDRKKFRQEIANFIHVDGAVINELGPNGETNSHQITEEVDGLSGSFPNGAPWIPTPPLFQDYTFSNELIDTNAKAFEVAERYFDIKNRLFEEISITIPIDPDVFLGETIEIVDPNYTSVRSLYFIKGYSHSVSADHAETTLQLVGGPEAGTAGLASPFAEFWWSYTQIHQFLHGGSGNGQAMNMGHNANNGAKLCEDDPDEDPDDPTPDPTPGVDKRTVIVGLDGSQSEDFDGFIVDWLWEWMDGEDVFRTYHGPRVTIVVDPDEWSNVEMRLTVTDNTARTGVITKSIYTNADYMDPGCFDEDGDPVPCDDPSNDDSDNGGGPSNGPCCDPETEDCSTPTNDPNPDPLDDPSPGMPGGGGGAPPGSTGGGCEGSTGQPGACAGMMTGYILALGAGGIAGSTNNRDWNTLDKTELGVTGDVTSVASGINVGTQKFVAVFGTSRGEIVKTTDVGVSATVVFTIPGNPAIKFIRLDNNEMGAPAQGDTAGNEGGTDGAIPVYTAGSPGELTIIEAFQQCLAVGFDPTPAITAVAIMLAESGLQSGAVNVNPGPPESTDRGIAQINDVYHPEVSDACAYNTECAIGAMLTISSGGTNFRPWATFTGGAYKQYLSAVRDATGMITTPEDGQGFAPCVPNQFKFWLGTDDGRIFTSTDSGDTWEPFANTHDALNDFIDNEQISAVFGGTSDRPNGMIKVLDKKNARDVTVGGALKAAIDAMPPGTSIVAAATNKTSLLIGFSNGEVWTSSDPVNDPSSWTKATGISGDVHAAAGGFDGEFIVAAGNHTYSTSDNVGFTETGTPSSPISKLTWQGMSGKYIASGEDGMFTTVNNGVGWGVMYPNATFGTGFPAGATGEDVAFVIGPNECSPGMIIPPGETCVIVLNNISSIPEDLSIVMIGRAGAGASINSVTNGSAELIGEITENIPAFPSNTVPYNLKVYRLTPSGAGAMSWSGTGSFVKAKHFHADSEFTSWSSPSVVLDADTGTGTEVTVSTDTGQGLSACNDAMIGAALPFTYANKAASSSDGSACSVPGFAPSMEGVGPVGCTYTNEFTVEYTSSRRASLISASVRVTLNV